VPEDGKRIPARLLCPSVRSGNHLVGRPIGDELQGIRDARQVMKKLVAYGGPVQDNSSFPAESLNGPSP